MTAGKDDRLMVAVLGRRRFLAVVVGDILTAPFSLQAQPAGKVWRIGVLLLEPEAVSPEAERGPSGRLPRPRLRLGPQSHARVSVGRGKARPPRRRRVGSRQGACWAWWRASRGPGANLTGFPPGSRAERQASRDTPGGGVESDAGGRPGEFTESGARGRPQGSAYRTRSAADRALRGPRRTRWSS